MTYILSAFYLVSIAMFIELRQPVADAQPKDRVWRTPMKSRLIFVSLLFFAQMSICSAQDFSVRLIDVRNGRPFPNQTVTIQYRKITGGSLDFETLAIKTDANGSATFQLPTPTPPKVSVTAYDLYPCYDLLPTDSAIEGIRPRLTLLEAISGLPLQIQQASQPD